MGHAVCPAKVSPALDDPGRSDALHGAGPHYPDLTCPPSVAHRSVVYGFIMARLPVRRNFEQVVTPLMLKAILVRKAVLPLRRIRYQRRSGIPISSVRP